MAIENDDPTSTKLDPEFLTRMAVDIAVAFLAKNAIARSEVPLLLRDVRAALDVDVGRAASAPGDWVTTRDSIGTSATPAAATKDVVTPLRPPALSVCSSDATEPQVVPAMAPAVPIDASVTEDYIISLEDGRRFRSLRRHLMAHYGMTPEDYKRKWCLPDDYPMVAPSYARDRSEVAKRSGLGRRPKSKRLPTKAEG